MLRKLLLFSIVFIATVGNAQNDSIKSTALHLVGDYPQGVYMTFEDFLAKKVSPLPKLERRFVPRDLRVHRDSLVNHVFFYNVPAFNKYSDAAVICENGQLYVRQRDIEKLTQEGDRRYGAENPRTYHRVISDGKFLYFEGPFSNMWKKAVSAGLGNSSGVANAMMETRGLVYNFETKEFDIFKDCDDFKKFLKEHKISESVNCSQFGVLETRRVITKHNK
ncbi:hypothetical protein [Flavobacterium selenitireducens]|uniref:hypothetical protein n=1 Tax=Flavobacterium selenitireducens TaxID=2722704 RepID=UPI00168AC92B|nr:hypothetical protein [Flavobacterium selenitireducens]MBD3581674.1 hypothetical protein [Flavobacterium selenitireducens]